MPLKTLRFLGKTYGPYAYGVIVVVVLWKLMLEPHMQEAKQHQGEFARSVEKLETVTRDLARATENLLTATGKMK